MAEIELKPEFRGGISAKNLNFSRFTLNWREEPKNCGIFLENCESVRIVNVSQHQVHADHLKLFSCVKIRILAKFMKNILTACVG